MQLEYFHLMQITVRVEMLLKLIDISSDTLPNKKKTYTFSLLNSKIKMRDFFFERRRRVVCGRVRRSRDASMYVYVQGPT